MGALPKGIRENREAVAETIENNVRRLIIDEQPINPKYYEKMSELLDALIAQRKRAALDYQKYLENIVELTKKVTNPTDGESYPKSLNTSAKRALYDNLRMNEAMALAIDAAVLNSRQDDWRNNPFKVRKIRLAIKAVFEKFSAEENATLSKDGQVMDPFAEKYGGSVDKLAANILELVKNQNAY